MNPQLPESGNTTIQDADEPLIDVRLLQHFARFAANAVVRRWAVALMVFTAVVATTVAGLLIWPKTYHVEAKVVARRNDLMTSLSNPTRMNRPEADDPTRAASEMMYHRDNLLSVIRHTNLVADRERTRSPLSRAKQYVSSFLHEINDQDRVEALVGTLRSSLSVAVDRENIVTIRLDWPDSGQLANDIVETALDNFIEMRHGQETSAITEAITILQNSASSLQSDVDRTISALRKEQVSRPAPRIVRRPDAMAFAGGTAMSPSHEQVVSGPTPVELAELSRISADIDTTRQNLRRLEGARTQQLNDLNNRLATAMAVYTADHPTVVGLRQSVEAASQDTPEMAALRVEEASLLSQSDVLEDGIEKANAEERLQMAVIASEQPQPKPQSQQTAPAPAPAPQPAVTATPMLAVLPADVSRLTDLVNPTSRLLTLQLAQLANLLDRINGARLELATSSAGIKYRYNVTRPPQVPDKPVKPNTTLVMLAGIVAALMLSLMLCIALELLGGLVLEAWQLERLGNVPVFVVPAGAIK